ncbi:hypothetical protein POL68_31830 [Stigmatella sp. ncwal1]|uniref:Uncharacterized protein n=1 Tax=Stigmatella ashevillensis TaxID=2995309 RepID=A0ABT5DHE6_9BACT|nr:hypothetical protein [Stigmatella ashevillena]MDC0713096.1 hypothetical protein [Stigmatella ashevillena]
MSNSILQPAARVDLTPSGSRDVISAERLLSLLRGVAGALRPDLVEKWNRVFSEEQPIEKYFGAERVFRSNDLLTTLKKDAGHDPFLLLVKRALFMQEVLTLAPEEAPRFHMAEVLKAMDLEHPELQPFFFKNPLGFFTFYLFLAKDIPDRIRMHIWPQGKRLMQDEQLQIHNHRTQFRSWIVSGSLVDENFEVNVVESKTANSLYKIVYQAFEDSVMQNMNVPVVYKKTGERQVGAGQNYFLAEKIYHHTEVALASYTATVFHAQPSASYPEPFVVGPCEGEQFHFDRFQGVGPEIAASVLGELRQKLASL